jgi:orotidine-5'-phosphate decarboxylase
MEHFADRLLEAIGDKGGPVCVGIDPDYGRLPEAVRGRHPLPGSGGDPTVLEDRMGPATFPEGEAEETEPRIAAIRSFVIGVLDAVAEHVPCVKLQSACFERYGWRGVRCYEDLIQAAHDRGLLVIGDVKRGDIGASAAHYAAGMLRQPTPERAADAITINPYFGRDGVEPFVEAAAQHSKGVFALVRTSNPGGDAVQAPGLADGRSVAEAVGDLVAELGEGAGRVGDSGYSALGAVVGATKPSDAASLRSRMARQWFLVPGFGAQGGAAEDVRACFDADGGGAVVTASRSITYAFEKEGGTGEDWPRAVERAAVEMKRQLNGILGA